MVMAILARDSYFALWSLLRSFGKLLARDEDDITLSA
jgi:hypothetical protein